MPFQSTSSVWRTTATRASCNRFAKISIHVLRVEDDETVKPNTWYTLISIHVLRVEDDCFLLLHLRQHIHFNPRPPCGGRHMDCAHCKRPAKFQSTSSVWRTTVAGRWKRALSVFQSTSSVWRTTFEGQPGMDKITISIHVLRVEDDRRLCAQQVYRQYFNPRPPCGGRLPFSAYSLTIDYFNPRPPCGGRPPHVNSQ